MLYPALKHNTEYINYLSFILEGCLHSYIYPDNLNALGNSLVNDQHITTMLSTFILSKKNISYFLHYGNEKNNKNAVKTTSLRPDSIKVSNYFKKNYSFKLKIEKIRR